MKETDDIRTKLQAYAEFVDNVIERTRNGEIVNVSHLEGEMTKLCTRIGKLSEDEAGTLEDVMAELIAKLERLTIELKEFQERAGWSPANDDDH